MITTSSHLMFYSLYIITTSLLSVVVCILFKSAQITISNWIFIHKKLLLDLYSGLLVVSLCFTFFVLYYILIAPIPIETYLTCDYTMETLAIIFYSLLLLFIVVIAYIVIKLIVSVAILLLLYGISHGKYDYDLENKPVPRSIVCLYISY